MSSSSQGQSIPHAVLATADWDRRQPVVQLPPKLNPFLSIRKGNKGWAFGYEDNFVFVHMFGEGNVERGWVPQYVLKKGVLRQEPLPIILPFQSAGSSGFSTASTEPSENNLQKTLRLLWSNIVRNKSRILENIPSLAETAQKVLFHPAAAMRYADAVYHRLTLEARTIMANGNFNPTQLGNLRNVSADYPKVPGIYIILYRDFGTKTFGVGKYTEAIYVGQTNNFQVRNSMHQADTEKNILSNHYRVARKANQRRMVPILLQQSGAVPQDFLDIAELTMVCLFRAWYPFLYTGSGATPSAAGSYGIDFDAAAVFSGIAKDAGRQTGWSPARLFGLNWNTPVVRNRVADQKWVSWEDTGKNMTIYRTRRRVQIQPSFVSFAWDGYTLITIPDNLQKTAKFVHGQTVHVVVESQRDVNGNPASHPFRWTRYPSIGPNPELEKLKSFAVKLEWLPKGTNQWMSSYVERSKIWMNMKQHRDVLSMYERGMVMMMALTRTSYANAPSWIPRYMPHQVQHLEYDHLEQRYVVRTVPDRQLPWPRDWTIQENSQRLREMFPLATFGWTAIGHRPVLEGRRTSCDICLSQMGTAHCAYMPDKLSCQFCIRFNRPCTFTDDTQVLNRFKQGGLGDLEELAIPFNLTRLDGGNAFPIDAPFDPDLEAEEHTQLAAV